MEPHADPAMRELYWGHRNRTPWPAEPPGELVGEIHADPGHPREEFFEPWREHRRRRYASVGAPARKRRAVLTMVHNEAVFLPIWLRYYSRFFAPEDIYVLDNDTTDGSTDGDGFVRIPVAQRSRRPHLDGCRRSSAFQHELLERYDVVLVTDVDEIIAPDPSWGTLGQYIDRFDEEFVNCPRLRDPPPEGSRAAARPRPADPRPARHTGSRTTPTTSPLLATVPMDWEPGFHATRRRAATTSIRTCA